MIMSDNISEEKKIIENKINIGLKKISYLKKGKNLMEKSIKKIKEDKKTAENQIKENINNKEKLKKA